MTCVASYTYQTRSRRSLYQAQRFEDGDGRKSFGLRRADGNGGWTGGTGAMDGVGRVAYRWPDLVDQKTVYAVEGEGCADALWNVGVPATTNVGGAGKWNSGPFHDEHDYAAQLTMVGVGNVVVLPDNDDPGRRHAEDVAASCHTAGLHVKVIELPDLPPKGDVVDFLGNHSKGDLFALVTAAPEWTPRAAVISETPHTGEILDDLVAFIRRYVVVSDEQATVIALWVVHTHAFGAAENTPYLNVTSATKQAGKTRLLEVLELVVRMPWLAGRVTPAVLVRRIEKETPTLLLDESDAAFKRESDYAEALRAILNSGYRASGKASLCLNGGSSYKDFSVYCPKAIAGIGHLPDTVSDRSIPIRLRRRTTAEPIERFRQRDARREAEPLKDAVETWCSSRSDALLAWRPSIPAALGDRAADVCEPLLAIAEAVGGTWPDRARAAVVRLCTGRDDEQSLGTQLLADIRTIFDETDADAVFSEDLITSLIKKEESVWGELWNGKPLTKNRLARLLKPFEVRPAGTIRLGERTGKGYRRAAFLDAWTRYLPAQASHRHNPNNDGGGTAASDRHTAVTQRSQPDGGEPCDGVTDAQPTLAFDGQSDAEPGESHDVEEF